MWITQKTLAPPAFLGLQPGGRSWDKPGINRGKRILRSPGASGNGGVGVAHRAGYAATRSFPRRMRGFLTPPNRYPQNPHRRFPLFVDRFFQAAPQVFAFARPLSPSFSTVPVDENAGFLHIQNPDQKSASTVIIAQDSGIVNRGGRTGAFFLGSPRKNQRGRLFATPAAG